MSDFSMWDNKKIPDANSLTKLHSSQELMILTLEYMLSGNVSYRPMEKTEDILSSFFNSFPPNFFEIFPCYCLKIIQGAVDLNVSR